MKKLLFFIVSLFLITMLFSCESEDITEPTDEVATRGGLIDLPFTGDIDDFYLVIDICDLFKRRGYECPPDAEEITFDPESADFDDDYPYQLSPLKYYYLQYLVNEYEVTNHCEDAARNLKIEMNPNVECGVYISDFTENSIKVEAWLTNELKLEFNEEVSDGQMIAGSVHVDYNTGLLSGEYSFFPTGVENESGADSCGLSQ